MKKIAAKLFAKLINWKNKRWIENPIAAQEKTLKVLIKKASKTKFGRDHDFASISNYMEFKSRVSINDYEGIRPYIDSIIAGDKDVLWPGKPLYLAKTSGTTSGAKHIPITKESMPTHINSARDAILNYIIQTGNVEFLAGKQIFIQGSPVLENLNGISLGRLSGIVAHFVPSYLKKNRMPSWKTNCMEDWEDKVDAIVNETFDQNMTVIGGIPSWVQMYFEKIIKKTGNTVGKQFPEFSLFIHGGVNFEPYQRLFDNLIGRKIDSIELFPASEGFFAYQDKIDSEGLLLLVDNGIFYEFVEAEKFFDPDPERISLKDVKLGVNYVLILSSNAGLWSYNIGDTVSFVSDKPYRVIVTGRIKQYISAFGEHVIVKEVETALKNVIDSTPIEVREFTVAPQINPSSGLPHHDWFIDFKNPPENIEDFSKYLDSEMRKQNIYYDDLIKGKVLKPLNISIVENHGFEYYMKETGKLGGQNKVPRLSNDRKIANRLSLKKY
ncbi:MAG: GH3 auxin-responsive promoter family protein [Flavobacteriaceae bacterium]|nr:GH3 auxin-responsive promoter family protein [Flavobacteriaceae bacterium]